ncbi:MAG: divergent polysaccharide deacetylase family protein [Gammaproteobacteria bacterium]|nr:divergent polysaccharide deacetylase family protein [Gammaproteobacteria bacterium]
MTTARHRRGQFFRIILTGLAAVALTPVHAQSLQPEPVPPRISIIIDDLGDQFERDWRVVRLPGAVSLAFLPYSPYSRDLAERAHRLGKDVLLHLPMESIEHHPLGPGAITLDMTENEVLRTISADLASVPHAIGINNHMGSLLTRHPGHMQWLMSELKRRGNLFFIDSRTTARTVALRLAQENQVPALGRDVFLDDDPSPAAIKHEFQRLIKLARQQGHAVAIGHPHQSTLNLLERELPTLESLGIQLIPISALILAPNASTPTEAAVDNQNDNKALVYYQSRNTSAIPTERGIAPPPLPASATLR